MAGHLLELEFEPQFVHLAVRFSLQLSSHCQQVEMVFTSVAGHLLELEFEPRVKGWHSCAPRDLYDASVHKGVPKVGADGRF